MGRNTLWPGPGADGRGHPRLYRRLPVDNAQSWEVAGARLAPGAAAGYSGSLLQTAGRSRTACLWTIRRAGRQRLSVGHARRPAPRQRWYRPDGRRGRALRARCYPPQLRYRLYRAAALRHLGTDDSRLLRPTNRLTRAGAGNALARQCRRTAARRLTAPRARAG